jgi:uncharacterized LabA/DUF88 family protein
MTDVITPPQQTYAMAFFDGQNLYRHAKDAFGHHHPNYDPTKLHHAVCAHYGFTPNLTRFYSGVPEASESPMWSAYWSNRVLAMKRANVHVITRKIRYHEEQIGLPDGTFNCVRTPHEKGIDVRIALDLVACARRREFQAAILFSQDSDLAEVVDEIRAIAREQMRRIEVVCAFPDSPTASCRRGIDKTTWFRMDQSFYDACLDHHDYRPRRPLISN